MVDAVKNTANNLGCNKFFSFLITSPCILKSVEAHDMNITCPCHVCSATIEFDSIETGKATTCPHCGMETVLFMPMHDKNKTIEPPKSETVEALRPKKKRHSSIIPIVVFLLGFGLVQSGLSIKNANVINEVYAGIQYCTGLVIICLSLILNMLRNIANNQ
jgi:DNA-directed RNA polymerase subunit RPC12/RpoP